MPRRLRSSSGGYVYHVLNRAVDRARIFETSGDYAAFEKTLREAKDWLAMRVLAYCLMPNHWHVVVWPYRDGDLSEFFRWLTVTHTQRWHAHHHSAGTGPLYQGRFKSFPIEADDHLLTVGRYVERNALRAGLVPRAEHWRWSSLWHRVHESGQGLLDPWPVAVPDHWLRTVNGVETEAELAAVRRCLLRGMPYGNDDWTTKTARKLGLESSLRPRGRPKKEPEQIKDSRPL